jgi:hypothetical protein
MEPNMIRNRGAVLDIYVYEIVAMIDTVGKKW